MSGDSLQAMLSSLIASVSRPAFVKARPRLLCDVWMVGIHVQSVLQWVDSVRWAAHLGEGEPQINERVEVVRLEHRTV